MPSLHVPLLVGAAAVAAGLLLYSRRTRVPKTVVITGGCGNLGIKLATHLLGLGYQVILLEHPKYIFLERVPKGATVVPADLELVGAWTHVLRGADTLVHFSAVNPYPNANWAESAGSMSHTFNVFLAAARMGVRRVLFASSNHVMGGYKDLADVKTVSPRSPPMVGTLLRDLSDRAKSGDAVAYAAAKLAGEQLARALAATTGGATTFIALRIGWCQPGDNLPSTLNPAGTPPQFQNAVSGGGSAPAASDQAVDENWFKNMWLSNGDFLRCFTAAIGARVPPGELLLLNAMSNNSGMKWSIAETEAALGVQVQDNSRA
jgi:nucleoside-diphosphate-sugar epimerase